MIDTRYPFLSRAVSTSLIWRIGVGVVDVTASAWRDSRIARFVHGLAELATVRSIALIGAIAVTLDIVAQPAVPTYVRSGVPLAWLPIVTFLIVVAVWPAEFERAWSHSILASLSRRLVHRSLGEGG